VIPFIVALPKHIFLFWLSFVIASVSIETQKFALFHQLLSYFIQSLYKNCQVRYISSHNGLTYYEDISVSYATICDTLRYSFHSCSDC